MPTQSSQFQIAIFWLTFLYSCIHNFWSDQPTLRTPADVFYKSYEDDDDMASVYSFTVGNIYIQLPRFIDMLDNTHLICIEMILRRLYNLFSSALDIQPKNRT